MDRYQKERKEKLLSTLAFTSLNVSNSNARYPRYYQEEKVLMLDDDDDDDARNAITSALPLFRTVFTYYAIYIYKERVLKE